MVAKKKKTKKKKIGRKRDGGIIHHTNLHCHGDGYKTVVSCVRTKRPFLNVGIVKNERKELFEKTTTTSSSSSKRTVSLAGEERQEERDPFIPARWAGHRRTASDWSFRLTSSSLSLGHTQPLRKERIERREKWKSRKKKKKRNIQQYHNIRNGRFDSTNSKDQ